MPIITDWTFEDTQAFTYFTQRFPPFGTLVVEALLYVLIIKQPKEEIKYHLSGAVGESYTNGSCFRPKVCYIIRVVDNERR